ncbi:MAG: hypothetical protein EP329_08365 [Deltaproteobacteria bacterium]|nr:MAG: hypothetical protein EP329_08365 [Deltaproteobacteria bacterium]
MRKLWTTIIAALGLIAGCADGATETGTIVPPGECQGPAASDASALTAASFQLTDFQPKSCGYGQTYGLERFVGKPTLVSLLAGW